MRIKKCPHCNKTYLDFEADFTGRFTRQPTITCRKCGKTYPDDKFTEIALKPYRQPKKSDVLLCGLWPFGIIGFCLIIIGMLLNLLWLVIIGGLVFSFWILLIAMSLCLWQDVCINARKEYDASVARLANKQDL